LRVEAPLHLATRMRAVLGLALALAASGCAAEMEAAPRTMCPPPRVGDDFDDAFVYDEHLTPAEPAPSRSLGYLGDRPIGVLPMPPHHEPAWTRPFPCDWTGTCRWPPPPPYYPPLVEVYGGY
jgi:hypothetical protein